MNKAPKLEFQVPEITAGFHSVVFITLAERLTRKYLFSSMPAIFLGGNLGQRVELYF